MKSVMNKVRNLADSLSRQAKERPDAEAVVSGDTRLTFAQLNNRSLAIAEQLQALGIGEKNKVGVLYPNDHEFIAVFFAVLRLGAVVVPINPLLRSSEIAHILSDSEAKAIIVHAACQHEVLEALPELQDLNHLIVGNGKIEDMSNIVLPKGLNCVELTAKLQPSDKPLSLPPDTDPEKDLALLVYTSGTTGKPKGAMLTHSNVQSVFPYVIFTDLHLDENDRFLGMLPLCHIYGAGALVYTMAELGSTIVIMQQFEAAKAIEILAKERITVVPAVPTMYQFMLMEKNVQQLDYSALRYCISAAAPVSMELVNKIESVFKAKVVEGYGMSETAGGGTVNPPNAGKVGSVGKPIGGVRIAIFSDDMTELPLGAENVGEIAINGPCVTPGYHKQPEATKSSMHGEWLLTGDLGYLDEDGYLYIVGRKKELIIRGGQNIYPREIEEVLFKMDHVKDAAVIGVPDELMGERVKAFVVTDKSVKLTDEQVKEFCGEHLAPYKVPRLVEFIDQLPRNSTGKVLKRLLK